MSSRNKKDRVLNTRISEELDRELREQAERLDMPVSQLVRNILGRTVDLVGNLSGNIESLVHNVVDDVASFRTVASPASGKPSKPQGLDNVIGWQAITISRPSVCAVTGETLAKGSSAHLSLRSDGGPRAVIGDKGLEIALSAVAPPVEWVPIVLQQEVTCGRSRPQRPGHVHLRFGAR